jgi:hypothetical protein
MLERLKEAVTLHGDADMHTQFGFQLFVWLYHVVDRHGTEYRTRLDLERMLSREEGAVVFFTEANILSMLASDFCWEGACVLFCAVPMGNVAWTLFQEGRSSNLS